MKKFLKIFIAALSIATVFTAFHFAMALDFGDLCANSTQCTGERCTGVSGCYCDVTCQPLKSGGVGCTVLHDEECLSGDCHMISVSDHQCTGTPVAAGDLGTACTADSACVGPRCIAGSGCVCTLGKCALSPTPRAPAIGPPPVELPTGAPPPKINLENPLGGSTGEVSVPKIIGNIVKTLLTIVGALALGMFVYGGFTWLTSGGSSEKIKKGKDILMWATIGLIVIFSSYTLVDFLLKAFGL